MLTFSDNSSRIKVLHITFFKEVIELLLKKLDHGLSIPFKVHLALGLRYSGRPYHPIIVLDHISLDQAVKTSEISVY